MIVGSAPVGALEVFKRLAEQVEKRATNGGAIEAHTPWTRAVFVTLKEDVVRRHGGRAVFSQPPDCSGPAITEFMLDFLWWEQDERGFDTLVMMAAECEWASAASDCVKAVADD